MNPFSPRATRTITIIVVLLAGTFSGLGTADTPDWQPPIGVPMASFGIVETARATPSPWVAPTAGFYYVDETAVFSTDLANPYGTPTKPRKTIPTVLPAGSVVELHGTYSFRHTSPRGILLVGTRASPVFIRGISPASRPLVTGCWEVWGSYYVIENLEFSACGSIILLGRTDHAALRHSDVHGNLSGGGVGVVSWDGDPLNDVVLWDNLIHDNGNLGAPYDQDVHGIAVGSHVSNLWVVDNQLYRNSGDGIQINAGSASLQATTHHIYVGRNKAYDNKQSGFWTKQAVDVIFSQNSSYRHRASNSSLGACMGGQYAPEFVWYINNTMWDCEFGIQMASDSELGTGRHHFYIGNLIAGIHDTDGGFEVMSAWQNCAISLPGGTFRYVLENSLYDVDSGICIPGASGKAYLFDNLIQKVRADGHHLIFDAPTMAETMVSGSNLFAPNFRLGVGGASSVSELPEPVVKGENNLVRDVGWVNPVDRDFRLTPNSPARDNGLMDTLGVWEYFRSRYGTTLSFDVHGVTRESAPDSGAVEFR